MRILCSILRTLNSIVQFYMNITYTREGANISYIQKINKRKGTIGIKFAKIRSIIFTFVIQLNRENISISDITTKTNGRLNFMRLKWLISKF